MSAEAAPGGAPGERMPVDRARLDRMLNPRTVVVVGEKGPGYQFLKSQLEYRGNLYSVQIDEKEIPGIEELGVTNVTSMDDVPGDIDLVISAVSRQVAPFITKQAVARGVAGVHFFTAGFAETGDEQGLALQEQILGLLREDGMPAIGPNCMGVYNRTLGLRFHAAQDVGADEHDGGALSILSQSGTHGVNLTVGAQRAGVRVGRTISFGNALVVSESDLLAYLRDDEGTEAIAIYLEGVREGRRFFELLRETTQRKPVVVWRGGESQAGARAVRSHTGSLASQQAVWDAMVRQAGAIPAGSLDDAVDAVAALAHTSAPTGRRLGLITMTGGQSVAITDEFERAGFTVPELSADSYETLAGFYNVIGGSYRNPFDAGSTIRELENLGRLLDVIEADPAVDGGVAIDLNVRLFSDEPEQFVRMLDALERFRESSGQPVIATLHILVATLAMTDREEESREAVLARAREQVVARGFASYPDFRRAAAALRRVVDYHARQEAQGGA